MKSGKSIEQLRLAEDGTTGKENDDMSDYQTAHRWYEDKEQELLPGFKVAFRFCLTRYLNADTSFEDDKLRDEVEENVLRPLRSDLSFLETTKYR